MFIVVVSNLLNEENIYKNIYLHFLSFEFSETAHIVEISLCKSQGPSWHLSCCVHGQNYGFWCPGNARSQGISSHGIDILTVLTHWVRDEMDNISQTTFPNAFSWMNLFEFRLKFHWSLYLGGSINNIPALVQIMAWHRPGNKPLSEPMIVILLMRICVTRPQWVNTRRVNTLWPRDRSISVVYTKKVSGPLAEMATNILVFCVFKFKYR